MCNMHVCFSFILVFYLKVHWHKIFMVIDIETFALGCSILLKGLPRAKMYKCGAIGSKLKSLGVYSVDAESFHEYTQCMREASMFILSIHRQNFCIFLVYLE
jgi:hypothetical protein